MLLTPERVGLLGDELPALAATLAARQPCAAVLEDDRVRLGLLRGRALGARAAEAGRRDAPRLSGPRLRRARGRRLGRRRDARGAPPALQHRLVEPCVAGARRAARAHPLRGRPAPALSRSSTASTRAGCAPSGSPTRIDTPRCRSAAASASAGMSRVLWRPGARKNGCTTISRAPRATQRATASARSGGASSRCAISTCGPAAARARGSATGLDDRVRRRLAAAVVDQHDGAGALTSSRPHLERPADRAPGRPGAAQGRRGCAALARCLGGARRAERGSPPARIASPQRAQSPPPRTRARSGGRPRAHGLEERRPVFDLQAAPRRPRCEPGSERARETASRSGRVGPTAPGPAAIGPSPVVRARSRRLPSGDADRGHRRHRERDPLGQGHRHELALPVPRAARARRRRRADPHDPRRHRCDRARRARDGRRVRLRLHVGRRRPDARRPHHGRGGARLRPSRSCRPKSRSWSASRARAGARAEREPAQDGADPGRRVPDRRRRPLVPRRRRRERVRLPRRARALRQEVQRHPRALPRRAVPAEERLREAGARATSPSR